MQLPEAHDCRQRRGTNSYGTCCDAGAWPTENRDLGVRLDWRGSGSCVIQTC